MHDATGAGSAIGEFPSLEAHRQLQGVTMVGRVRVRPLPATTSRRSSGTRSSVLGSTCSIPSICTAGKTICSGAGIRPIRSSPWRWPLTPSRQAASPVTTASPSEAHRTGGARHRPPEGLKTEATSRRAQMQDGRAVRPPPNVRTSLNPGGVRTSRRPLTFPLPVAPTRANVDGRRLPAAATTRRDPAHDPARDRLDHHPR